MTLKLFIELDITSKIVLGHLAYLSTIWKKYWPLKIFMLVETYIQRYFQMTRSYQIQEKGIHTEQKHMYQEMSIDSKI